MIRFCEPEPATYFRVGVQGRVGHFPTQSVFQMCLFHLDQLINVGRKVKVFVAKGPVYHYTYGRWRLKRWLDRPSVKATALDGRAFLAQFDLERSQLRRVKKAVVEESYADAETDLVDYFQTRTDPRFFFGGEDIGQTISLIANAQKEATICAADAVCQNVFNFRGAGPIEFRDGVDWTYCPRENADWTWDLNRHTFFETLGRAYWYTGDERYAWKFRELLLHWLADNPASVNQPNWASVFEVAFRINTWIWAFYYFRSSAAFDRQICLGFLKGLLTHGCYLDAYLELHARNNHLLLEAKALAMLGLLFPEYTRADKWRRRALAILYQQVGAQVCSDGVHGERTTHYHRVVAGELLELLVLLENNNVPIPAEIVDTLGRMIEFELWIAKPDGMIPLLGDSALEDTHLRFSAASGGPAFLGRSDLKSIAPPLDEASVWLLGPRRVKQYLDAPTPGVSLGSRAFEQGGYFVMRSGQGPEGAYLVFDCGSFGYKPAPGHSHADALSFELYALGQTLLVDPGVYGTHVGQEWRSYFRGSRAHNTVVVDGQDQTILLDERRVDRPAQVTLHQWISNDRFDLVDGSHNGYERLPQPITHRRQVFFAKPEYWVVIDLLLGSGKHCFDLYFHLMPGVDTRLDPVSGSLDTRNGVEAGLVIAPLATSELQVDLITGATAPIQGWISFFSGDKRPAPTLRYRQEGVAPVQVCTVLYPYSGGQDVSVAVSALDLDVEERVPVDGSRLTGLRIETDGYVDYLIVDRGPLGTHKAFVDYETDAQLLYLRHREEGTAPVRVIVRGGHQVLFRGQPLPNAIVY